MKEIIYLYKKYLDDYTFAEIEAYEDEQDAINRLKEEVSTYFNGLPFDECEEIVLTDTVLDECNIFTERYVFYRGYTWKVLIIPYSASTKPKKEEEFPYTKSVIFSKETSDCFKCKDDIYNEAFLRGVANYIGCKLEIDHLVTNVEILRQLGMKVTDRECLFKLEYPPKLSRDKMFDVKKNGDDTFTFSWRDIPFFM